MAAADLPDAVGPTKASNGAALTGAPRQTATVMGAGVDTTSPVR